MRNFNVQSGVIAPEKIKRTIDHRISHFDALKKIEFLKTLARTEKQKKDLDKIKSELIQTEQKKHEIRAVRNVNYTLGLRTGIHLVDHRQSILKQDENKDWKARQDAIKKSIALYKENMSLTKNFKKSKTKTIDREK